MSGLGISAPGFGFLGNAAIPGGNIRVTPYKANAVEFLPVGSTLPYLYQDLTEIPDTNDISMSLWHHRYGPTNDDFFVFGGGSAPFGPSTFRITFNQKLFLNFGTTGNIPVTGVIYLEGQWNHIFISLQGSSGAVKIKVNGVDASTNIGAVPPFGMAGAGIQFPANYSNGTQDFIDAQVWFGTYIDPDVPYAGGGGSVAVVPQPLVNGQDRTSLIGMLVDGANSYGLPPTYALTVADIENSYSTTAPDPGLSKIFSFNAAEINGVPSNPPTVTSGTNATNQQEMNAFIYYNTVPNVPNSWLQPSTPPDSSGVNTYLVFNMGAQGSQAILTAPPGTLIQNLTTQSGAHIGNNMLNQTWAKGPPGGRYGFPDALTGSSLVSDWIARLSGVYKGVDGAWIQSGFDASSRVTAAIGTFLNAFRDTNGHPVPPGVPAILFGSQQILFTGPANKFILNQGTGGNFLSHGAINNYFPPPAVP